MLRTGGNPSGNSSRRTSLYSLRRCLIAGLSTGALNDADGVLNDRAKGEDDSAINGNPLDASLSSVTKYNMALAPLCFKSRLASFSVIKLNCKSLRYSRITVNLGRFGTSISAYPMFPSLELASIGSTKTFPVSRQILPLYPEL